MFDISYFILKTTNTIKVEIYIKGPEAMIQTKGYAPKGIYSNIIGVNILHSDKHKPGSPD